jgi:hypothetical protein
VRGELTNPEAQAIDLTKVMKEGKMIGDIRLEPKDIIYVPKKFIAHVNYFIEQILPGLTREIAVETVSKQYNP